MRRITRAFATGAFVSDNGIETYFESADLLKDPAIGGVYQNKIGGYDFSQSIEIPKQVSAKTRLLLGVDAIVKDGICTYLYLPFSQTMFGYRINQVCRGVESGFLDRRQFLFELPNSICFIFDRRLKYVGDAAFSCTNGDLVLDIRDVTDEKAVRSIYDQYLRFSHFYHKIIDIPDRKAFYRIRNAIFNGYLEPHTELRFSKENLKDFKPYHSVIYDMLSKPVELLDMLEVIKCVTDRNYPTIGIKHEGIAAYIRFVRYGGIDSILQEKFESLVWKEIGSVLH